MRAVQRDVWQGTPTPTGPVPEQRRRASGAGAMRRTRETGSRATVPRPGAVSQCRRVPVEDVPVVSVFGVLRTGRAEQTGELPADGGRRRGG